jgi:hypothetical protein
MPLPWQGFLAALSAGINEELWLRLGLMTFLVWLGTKLMKQERPSPRIVWIANGLTAIAFGMLHLPLAATLGPLTIVIVVRVLLLNGIAGIVFGWLYWRRGLLAAMVAHFITDIVLHVVAAALI